MKSIEVNGVDIAKGDIVGMTYNSCYKPKLWKLLFRLLAHIFVQKYDYTLRARSGRILFLNGYSTHRGNDQITFAKIKSCAGTYDEIDFCKKLRLANCFANIGLVISCCFRMRKNGILLQDKLLFCTNAVRARSFLRYLRALDLTTYCCAVVYNDLETFDNFFVQYMQKEGVLTATCQHGAFTAPGVSSNYLDAGIELTNSIADIFLAWNQMTYEEAIKAGMDARRLRILGIPKCIGEGCCERKQKTGRFGVVLNIRDRRDENIKMIQIANAVAKATNTSYYLKLHPNLRMNEYDDIADREISEVLPIDTTVAEYANMVDFSILTASTVYLELLFYHSRIYKLKTDLHDKFSKYQQYDFSTADELIKLLDRDYDMSEAFDYYCHTADPGKEYQAFFEAVIRETHSS